MFGIELPNHLCHHFVIERGGPSNQPVRVSPDIEQGFGDRFAEQRNGGHGTSRFQGVGPQLKLLLHGRIGFELFHDLFDDHLVFRASPDHEL